MADKKPDLSDLKARLGLTKPAPTSAPPPSASGPPAAQGAPGAAPPGAGPPSAGPRAATGPPGASGPPVGASGPPAGRPKPASSAAPQQIKSSGPTYSGHAASGSIDLSTIGGPALEAGKTFSPPVIAALVVSLLVGAVFMWGFMSGANQRQLLEIRVADGVKLRDAVKPKVAAFQELQEKIKTLSGTSPDFAMAEELASAEFAVSGSILATITIPLEGVTTDNVATYAADSAQLKQMLADHKRYTTGVDKEELTKLMQDNKAVSENAGFGIVLDPRLIAEGYEKDNYSPQMGKLVGFKKFDEVTKKVDIAILPAGDLRQVDIKQFIPIDKAQILKAGGQNAMQRYSYRLRNIKFQAHKISQYTTLLMDSLELSAGGEAAAPAPPPAEEAPAEEAPAEEAPAE